jgi:hypothetical protein
MQEINIKKILNKKNVKIIFTPNRWLFTKLGDVMRTYLLFMMMALSAFSAEVFANDFLQKDLLTQLYNLNDTSILDVKEDKYYLNTERIYVVQDGMYLNSDHFGLIALSILMSDHAGTYTVGLYYHYECDSCGACYSSSPSECGVCGGTSFSRVDDLPPED